MHVHLLGLSTRERRIVAVVSTFSSVACLENSQLRLGSYTMTFIRLTSLALIVLFTTALVAAEAKPKPDKGPRTGAAGSADAILIASNNVCSDIPEPLSETTTLTPFLFARM